MCVLRRGERKRDNGTLEDREIHIVMKTEVILLSYQEDLAKNIEKYSVRETLRYLGGCCMYFQRAHNPGTSQSLVCCSRTLGVSKSTDTESFFIFQLHVDQISWLVETM